MKFYVASSFQNIEQVRYFSRELTKRGFFHTYDWTENIRASTLAELKRIGEEEKRAVKEADVVVILLPAGKGSHIEMGMALALNKKVYLYSPNEEVKNPAETSTFYFLPEVERCSGSLEDLIITISSYKY
ncbi:group-specific protein [Bacillus salacetis]|uniref:Group-specific protein n=1 Tax=Bacillus salacetis TaxID=2315464 RepID=A0A3A1QPJ4_9BACI|nr:nucleoside 2-deoxyribosyltransferase [Bacillus salacetis]RIW28747.1 group-specific protein [Bacillus salacetis]